MKIFHSVSHQVDPLPAPALCLPLPPSCRVSSPTLAWTMTVAWPFPRVSWFSHIAACTIILRCRTDHVSRLVSATGYSCSWLGEGYPCTRSPKGTWSHSSRFKIHTAFDSIFGSTVPWVGWRTNMASHRSTCASAAKAQEHPHVHQQDVAEQRSHANSETISITANPVSLLCSVPTGAGPGCAVWGPCPESPIYVHPSPAPTCPPLWPAPPARAIGCSPARRERRALVPGTAGWQAWGCANPAACLTWRTHSEA